MIGAKLRKRAVGIVALWYACLPRLAFPGEALIYGNSVYDDATIVREAGLAYDQPPRSDDEIASRLRSTGHFSLVRVTREAGRLVIVVREKTPAFLLPYFSSSSRRKVFGLAGGLLGSDEGARTLLARYQLGTGNHEGALLYRHDFVFESLWVLGATVNWQDAERDVYAGGRDPVGSFANHEIDLTLGAGYHFTADALVGLDSHVEKHRFVDTDGSERRGTQVSHRLYGELGTLFADEGLFRGRKLKLYVEATNPLSSFSFVQWGALGWVSVFRHGDVNWVARPAWEAGGPLPLYQQFELGGPRLRGFPGLAFRTDRYVALQNDVAVAALPIGTKLLLRPFVFADWAYAENGGRTGAGAGFSLFFRHVAVPAIQIAGGYGFHPDGFAVTAAIGPQL